MKYFSIVIRVVAALIMLQTLYFKFTGHEESVKLFTTVGMEPWGRIGVGVMELVTSLLLLIPRTKTIGAIIGLGLMAGAIYFHLTVIGIVDASGSPLLFIYACSVTLICALVLVFHKKDLKSLVGSR